MFSGHQILILFFKKKCYFKFMKKALPRQSFFDCSLVLFDKLKQNARTTSISQQINKLLQVKSVPKQTRYYESLPTVDLIYWQPLFLQQHYLIRELLIQVDRSHQLQQSYSLPPIPQTSPVRKSYGSYQYAHPRSLQYASNQPSYP